MPTPYWTCSPPNCELSPVRFVSAPFSVLNTGGVECYMFLQDTPPLNIFYGSMDYHIYPTADSVMNFKFRIQDSAPHYFSTSWYYLQTSVLWGTELWIKQNHVWTRLATHPWCLTPDEWQRIECLWTRGCTFQGFETLQIELSTLEDTAPTPHVVFQHVPNLWLFSHVNGVGISQSNDLTWIDNFRLRSWHPEPAPLT